MLTPDGVGFYSYMTATVFGDTSISVDEVTSPRFFFIVRIRSFGLGENRTCITSKKKE